MNYGVDFAFLNCGFFYAGIGFKAFAAGGRVGGAIKGQTGRGGAGGKPAGSNPLEILAEGASGNNAVP
ncbi:hypothetical protein, partial [Enterobacter intestinihominis]